MHPALLHCVSRRPSWVDPSMSKMATSSVLWGAPIRVDRELEIDQNQCRLLHQQASCTLQWKEPNRVDRKSERREGRGQVAIHPASSLHSHHGMALSPDWRSQLLSSSLLYIPSSFRVLGTLPLLIPDCTLWFLYNLNTLLSTVPLFNSVQITQFPARTSTDTDCIQLPHCEQIKRMRP